MSWRDSVIDALHRYSSNHHTRIIERQRLIQEELPRIEHETNAQGEKNEQTLSRVLQELGSEGLLKFIERGKYVLLDSALSVESEDLPDDVLDEAICGDRLTISNIPTSDEKVIARRRRGQERLRRLTLLNYQSCCALCDVSDEKLLVASHIVRWADDPEVRGNLSNVICLCLIHDALFEAGYLSLADDFTILKQKQVESVLIDRVLDSTEYFRLPEHHPPLPEFLGRHRERTGFPN